VSTPIRLALQTLRANPLRTGLSTLGIVMGAASLSAILALADGTEAFARRRLEGEGLNAIVLSSRTADQVDGVRVPRSRVVRLTPADAVDVSAIAGPATIVTLVARGVVRWREAPGAAERAALVQGVTFVGTAPPVALAAGRDLAAADGAGPGPPSDPAAVVSASLAAMLAPDGPGGALGRRLHVGPATLTIVGVRSAPEGPDPPLLRVPYALLEALPLPAPADPPVLALEAARVEEVEALKAQVDAWAAARFGDGVTVAAQGRTRLRQAAQGILIFKLLMGSFTAIALLVGGIGIMNVLLASVLERTREIGVRRAVGARRRDVVLQLLAESVAIALAGSLIGLAAGIGGAFLVTAVMRARTEALIYAAVTPGTILASLGAAALTGLVFGVYPALRAARLAPVDAIRTE
jgi:putative ABC transport system permease protein